MLLIQLQALRAGEFAGRPLNHHAEILECPRGGAGQIHGHLDAYRIQVQFHLPADTRPRTHRCCEAPSALKRVADVDHVACLQLQALDRVVRQLCQAIPTPTGMPVQRST